MTEKLILETSVNYGDVDRAEVMLLGRLFKLLQEVAIRHANQFDTGTRAMAMRGESWVLHRIAVDVERYPRFEERLRVETWSSGIKGFRGFREFRVYDGGGQAVARGSSVWVYVNLKTKAIVRVPAEVAEGFPKVEEGVWCPELAQRKFPSPSARAMNVPVTLRYGDFDVNAHVNNAAYLDLVQTALAASGGPVCPRRIRMNFAKAIPAGTERVEVRVEQTGETVRIAIADGDVVFAVGET
jgi:acyl-ACP thioesterase